MSEEVIKAIKFYNKKLYTVKEVAEILSINLNAVYDLIKKGYLVGLKLGSMKVRSKDIDEFLEKYAGMDLTDLDNVKEVQRY